MMATQDEGLGKTYHWYDELTDSHGMAKFTDYYNIGVTVVFDPSLSPGIADLALNLAINKKTADVVEMNTCTLLRYPDLVRFRRDWLRTTHQKPIGIDQIRQGVMDCETLRVVRRPEPDQD